MCTFLERIGHHGMCKVSVVAFMASPGQTQISLRTSWL